MKLVRGKSIIDNLEYADTNGNSSNNWLYSTINVFLNGDYYNK